MASYQELVRASEDSDLLEKIVAAVAIAAVTIRDEDVGTPNHANRLLWAKNTLANDRDCACQMLPVVIADNKVSDLSTILAISDASIQTIVNATVNLFATG